ncbi:sigma-70 family RNA polymerase sigma factor [Streptomyces sp. NPDC048479]|uniref:sigma-70 family RNA polymerase sigma factor n=1 Tax=Streptomyces sp. NPDC048479 TaxID=3154725 RepID=UPI00343A263E
MRTAIYPVVPSPASARAAQGVPRRGWQWLLRGLSERHDEPIQLATTQSVITHSVHPEDGSAGIDELYHHRRLDLVRLALLLVDDLPTAEDVVQDSFAALFRRHGAGLLHVSDPEAYVRTSVVNGARSVLRRRRTARAYVPERERHAPPAEEHVLLGEEHQEVLKALRQLTRRQREVLVLRYWSNLSEAQIADTLGVSRGTVKSTAKRALDALGKQLGVSR